MPATSPALHPRPFLPACRPWTRPGTRPSPAAPQPWILALVEEVSMAAVGGVDCRHRSGAALAACSGRWNCGGCGSLRRRHLRVQAASQMGHGGHSFTGGIGSGADSSQRRKHAHEFEFRPQRSRLDPLFPRSAERIVRQPRASNKRSSNRSRLTTVGNVTAQLRHRLRSTSLPSAATMVTSLNPKVTILRRGLTSIALPSWIIDQIGEDFNEVMAYPKIDLPMYKPLTSPNVERLLPNINKIANNSITLMETNQRFIEAYMVGLNHEFARKLLWREYPTDQRGSYFRQFWAVDNYIDSEGLSDDALKEKLYDIPETSSLGARLVAGRSQQSRSTRPASRAAGGADHPRRAAEEVSQHRDFRPARQDRKRTANSRLADSRGRS